MTIPNALLISRFYPPSCIDSLFNPQWDYIILAELTFLSNKAELNLKITNFMLYYSQLILLF